MDVRLVVAAHKAESFKVESRAHLRSSENRASSTTRGIRQVGKAQVPDLK